MVQKVFANAKTSDLLVIGAHYGRGMQLKPRYGTAPILSFAPSADTPALAVSRQARRLLRTVSSLSPQQWTAPTRCDDWSVRDVISHLVTTNGFWSYSLNEGLRGEPSSLLANFDPVHTPPLLVSASKALTSDEILEQFRASVELWDSQLAALSDEQWYSVAEAPPGHIGVREIAAHSLWDCATHERDIAIPLGLTVTNEPDEIAWSVKYVAALGPAFLATEGSTREALLTFSLNEPELAFTVEVGSTVVVRDRRASDPQPLITGSAVAVLEGLSCRAPLPSVPATQRWMLEGLTAVFEANS